MTSTAGISESDFQSLGASGFADATHGRKLPAQDWRTGLLSYGGDGRGDFGQPIPTGMFRFHVRLVTSREQAYESGFEVGKRGGTQADLDAVLYAEYRLWAPCIGFSFQFERLFDANAPVFFATLTTSQGTELTAGQTLSLQSYGADIIADQAAMHPTLMFPDDDRIAGAHPLVLRLRLDDAMPQDIAFG